jgi:MurNAc alpha-1-phosphate uridylyltransferase
MVLAAGLGTRLRPVTDALPKPLVEAGGRSLIDHALDRLAEAGVERTVVNLHYKGEMLAAHLERRQRTAPEIVLSREERLLETGGGVKCALPYLAEHFFVLNGDVIWLDGVQPALARLAARFDPARLDVLLLLQPTFSAIGYQGSGDYFLDPLGAPRHRGEREIAPYIFSGIQILHRRVFDQIDDAVFSLRRVYDRAEAAGRLGGLVHDGEWFHVGTPDGLAATRARLSELRFGR